MEAVRLVYRFYADISARDFGPLALEHVRNEMIEAGLARTTINDRIHRIRRVFKWAVCRELVPPSVFEGLRALDGLRHGRSKAKAPKKAKPKPKAPATPAAPLEQLEEGLCSHVLTTRDPETREVLGKRYCGGLGQFTYPSKHGPVYRCHLHRLTAAQLKAINPDKL